MTGPEPALERVPNKYGAWSVILAVVCPVIGYATGIVGSFVGAQLGDLDNRDPRFALPMAVGLINVGPRPVVQHCTRNPRALEIRTVHLLSEPRPNSLGKTS